jgi:hypothetical protein
VRRAIWLVSAELCRACNVVKEAGCILRDNKSPINSGAEMAALDPMEAAVPCSMAITQGVIEAEKKRRLLFISLTDRKNSTLLLN